MHNNNSPIIKSFIYVGKYFFYDTFSNCLFSVSKEQYTEIILLQNIGTEAYLKLNKDTKSYYDILLLLKRGLMKSKIIDIIEHRDTVYMKELVDRCMCNITLQVTQDCNFKCRYCAFAFDNAIGRVHNKSSISMDIAKRSIDYLYDHSKDIDFLMVAFYGGEPLLNYKLITSIVEYTEKKFFTKNIEYRMTINGSLLNDEIMDFLIKYNFQIAISFDGPREIQDHHRLFKSSGNGTHDVVYNNILKLRKKNISYFNNSVRFISVAFSREEKKNVVHFFESINVDNSKIINLDADLSGVDYISDVNYKYYNRCDDILNSLPADNMPSIISSDDITSYDWLFNVYNDKSELPNKWHHNGPCVPTLEKMIVCVDGSLRICEKCLEQNGLTIGNIYNGIDYNKIMNYLNIGKLTEDDCKSCWAMRFCKMCALNCIDIETNKFSSEVKRIACNKIRTNALNFLKNYVSNHT